MDYFKTLEEMPWYGDRTKYAAPAFLEAFDDNNPCLYIHSVGRQSQNLGYSRTRVSERETEGLRLWS